MQPVKVATPATALRWIPSVHVKRAPAPSGGVSRLSVTVVVESVTLPYSSRMRTTGCGENGFATTASLGVESNVRWCDGAGMTCTGSAVPDIFTGAVEETVIVCGPAVRKTTVK